MLETLASWHPFIVHFAVAFSIGSVAFDILDFFLSRRRFEDAGFLLLIAAMPFLLLAVLTGNLAATLAPGIEHALVALDNHMRYANIAVWIFFLAGAWRVFLHLKRRYNAKRKVLYIFVITAAAASVYLAALHGGRIRHGQVGTGKSIDSHAAIMHTVAFTHSYHTTTETTPSPSSPLTLNP
ncbi:MAG: hypothetical protein RBU27_01045 [Bacteroidota bacterium]|jgi:uncharacterized membrane protein|nr:hypothetical protein [Bacteroidota bacterium]